MRTFLANIFPESPEWIVWLDVVALGLALGQFHLLVLHLFIGDQA